MDEYDTAVNHLKTAFPDGEFPAMKELKAEKARLSRQRDQQKAALRPLAEHRKQMRVIAGNVEAILETKTMWIKDKQQEQ